MARECRNCSVPVSWGWFCVECFRAFGVGISAAAAAWCARAIGLLALLVTVSCAAQPRPPASTPPAPIDRTGEFTATCSSVWRDELGRPIDADALKDCVHQAQNGRTGDEIRALVHDSAEAAAYREHLAHAHDLPALPSKAEFIQNYQGDFGNAKLPGCGFFNDSIFDPVSLMVTWTNDRECFEKTLAFKAAKGDNRLIVDPRADYHGGQGGAVIDLYHDPQRFAAFLAELRQHRNIYGEPFEVTAYFAADGHIGSFIGRDGHPDLEAEAHWIRDFDAIADVAGANIAATSLCWECRHVRDYMRPATYARLSKHIAAKLPNAWHGVHLVQGSSSISSWRCGDASDPACDAEPDDPFLGSEPGFWTTCRAEGYCDGLMFQFNAGHEYTDPRSYPNYTGQNGAMGRWWELVVRLCNDPRAAATSGGNRHGWPQADCLAFENIYDGYNTPPGRALVGDQSPADYAIDWCKRALALGGWGCGSASWRRERTSAGREALRLQGGALGSQLLSVAFATTTTDVSAVVLRTETDSLYVLGVPVHAEGFGLVVSPLLLGVEHVVGVRADEQMFRANAPRVVAAVKNIEPFGNRLTVRQNPRLSVRADRRVASVLAIDADEAVSTSVESASPKPTTVALLNIAPEPVGVVCSHAAHYMAPCGSASVRARW
jgi:hypothetical protein